MFSFCVSISIYNVVTSNFGVFRTTSWITEKRKSWWSKSLDVVSERCKSAWPVFKQCLCSIWFTISFFFCVQYWVVFYCCTCTFSPLQSWKVDWSLDLEVSKVMCKVEWLHACFIDSNAVGCLFNLSHYFRVIPSTNCLSLASYLCRLLFPFFGFEGCILWLLWLM